MFIVEYAYPNKDWETLENNGICQEFVCFDGAREAAVDFAIKNRIVTRVVTVNVLETFDYTESIDSESIQQLILPDTKGMKNFSELSEVNKKHARVLWPNCTTENYLYDLN